MALEAEPSPLAGVISNILQSANKNDSASSKPLPPLPAPTPTDTHPTASVGLFEKPQPPMPNGHSDINHGAAEEV
jgi:hypothetical protein